MKVNSIHTNHLPLCCNVVLTYTIMTQYELAYFKSITGIYASFRPYKHAQRNLGLILTIGEHRGCTCKFIMLAQNWTIWQAHRNFNTMIKRGIIYREKHTYYLTDYGQELFDGVNDRVKAITDIHRKALLTHLNR